MLAADGAVFLSTNLIGRVYLHPIETKTQANRCENIKDGLNA